jgi:hypothetical protein
MVTEFQYQLREGVSKNYGMYLSLTPPGKAKAVRSYRLDKGYMPVDIEAKIAGQYVMTDKKKKTDWLMSRNYTFIPYQNLSEYQKAMVRRTLEAKRLYRRTGTSLQLHEQSVRAIKGMMGEVKDVGVYRKTYRSPSLPSLQQKKREKPEREMLRKLPKETTREPQRKAQKERKK